MTDLTHNFHTTDQTLAARAARGRIAAIDACRQLHWLVDVREGEDLVSLAFDTAPSLVDIALRRRAEGRPGSVDVAAISVGRKCARLFVLMPSMRVKEPVQPALARARARVARRPATRTALFR